MTYNPNFSGKAEIEKAATVSTQEVNNTGNTIQKLTPVRVNSSGELETVDVSNEASVDSMLGIVTDNIGDGLSGSIANTGRIENIVTASSIGSKLYISKTGDLTDIKPSIGSNSFVEGDFVVAVGVVLKNIANPSQKDLMVNIQLLGQL